MDASKQRGRFSRVTFSYIYREKPEWMAVGGALLLFIFLQWLRPFYFLTDDNLTGYMPLSEEVFRRLATGQNVSCNPYLFGGFSLTQDAATISLFNPWLLIAFCFPASLRFLLLTDWFALTQLCVGSWAFVKMSRALASRYKLALPPSSWIYLALSWNFGVYSLAVGSSWVTFMGNQAALPILFWGLVEHSRKSFILLVVGVLYGFFCGHLHLFLTTSLLFSFLVAAFSVSERSPAPMIRWACAQLVLLILGSPLIIQAFSAVSSSTRSETVLLESGRMLNFPLAVQSGSLLAGPLLSLVKMPLSYFSLGGLFSFSLAFSGSFLLLATLLAKDSWRWKRAISFFFLFSCVLWFTPKKEILPFLPFLSLVLFGLAGTYQKKDIHALEKICIWAVPVLCLWLDRPDWLSLLLRKIPVYNLLRWPFREVILLTFVFHVLLLFNWERLGENLRKWTAGIGCALFLALLICHKPPSLNEMGIDRELLTSGKAESWWNSIKLGSNAESSWIAVMDPALLEELQYEIPFSLMGAYNYPSLFRMHGLSGYTGSWMNLPPVWQEKKPYHWSGIFSPEDARILRMAEPDLCYVELSSLGADRIQVKAYSPPTNRTWVFIREKKRSLKPD